MLYYDHEAHRQFARERAAELAREYRRAQKPPGAGALAGDAARRYAPVRLLARLRRQILDRTPAYRA